MILAGLSDSPLEFVGAYSGPEAACAFVSAKLVWSPEPRPDGGYWNPLEFCRNMHGAARTVVVVALPSQEKELLALIDSLAVSGRTRED